MNEERGSWYLLTGILLGAILGLVYAWLISPLKYVDTSPSMLRQDFKDQYRALVASAYALSGDITRAKARLDQLKDPDITQTMTIQAQRALAEGRPEAESRALGLLALALGQITSPTTAPSEAGVSLTPGLPLTNPAITTLLNSTSEIPGALTTQEPPPTQVSPYLLQESEPICEPGQAEPSIQVKVSDQDDHPLPGIELAVFWQGGEDHFFTGLKPESGLGYADFSMTPGITYTLTLVDAGLSVPEIISRECVSPAGDRFWGSWSLAFTRR